MAVYNTTRSGNKSIQDDVRSHKGATFYPNEKSEEFNKLMNSPRKTIDELKNQGGGFESAMKSLDEAMNFAQALLLASAKNMGLPGDNDSGNQAQEMSAITNSIAQMMATKANIIAQEKVVEAQKNPPVDLMSLENKVVDYEDGSKSFFGQPVNFCYSVSHTDDSPNAIINLNFTIKDNNGKIVKTIKQTGKIGEHKLTWDGRDDKGNKVPEGQYSMSIKGEGSKTVNGVRNSFSVTAFAGSSGVVESIKIEKGTAVGLIINGVLVERGQIINVTDAPKATSDKPMQDLIGKNISLDLSKAQVKNGILEVFYNNHVENSKGLTVKIYDKDNKFIKIVNSGEKIEQGIGSITFNNAELKDGDYIVKAFVNDVTDQDDLKETELKYDLRVIAVGIDPYNNKFKSLDEDIFSIHNITSIEVDYPTPLERKNQEYEGVRIVYKNDLFEYDDNMEPINFNFAKPDEDAIIKYGLMNIYDVENNELVAIVKGKYKPYELLEEASQIRVRNFMTGQRVSLEQYNEGSDEIRSVINRYIEDGLLDGSLRLLPEHQANYDAGKAPINFSAWDGTLNNGQRAENNRTYRREFTAIYVRENNTNFSGETDRQAIEATVESVDEEDGKYFLNLIGGARIAEELATKINEA